CFIIGILALPSYFVSSWFHETRAEMPILLLLLPGALEFYQRLFSIPSINLPLEAPLSTTSAPRT
ncbi:MAG: hypothetical protein NT000_05210, partial [Proteobacteria bacterium]|nr:hypothetical protein [Pseudomonadota bacterium]